jgi:hypothetical protein
MTIRIAAKALASVLGSARASRAGDGALAIANFSGLAESIRTFGKVHRGEAPQSAREPRPLPKAVGRLCKVIATSCVVALTSCESTTNYVPAVTPEMAAASARKSRRVDLAKLRNGRDLFVHRCIECHTLPPVWHYSSDDWPKIVNSMSHRAALKPAERGAIVAYIFAARSAKD